MKKIGSCRWVLTARPVLVPGLNLQAETASTAARSNSLRLDFTRDGVVNPTVCVHNEIDQHFAGDSSAPHLRRIIWAQPRGRNRPLVELHGIKDPEGGGQIVRAQRKDDQRPLGTRMARNRLNYLRGKT